LVSVYFEKEADRQLVSFIKNNHYKESELIAIKIPVSIPYGTNTANFENTEGDIDIDGINYTYVKRRFYKDSLELLCMPNFKKSSIKNAEDAFYKKTNDFVDNRASKKSSNSHPVTKFSTPDFIVHYSSVTGRIFQINYPYYFSSNTSFLSYAHLQRLDKPPQV
jgi:hypothetical protein